MMYLRGFLVFLLCAFAVTASYAQAPEKDSIRPQRFSWFQYKYKSETFMRKGLIIARKPVGRWRFYERSTPDEEWKLTHVRRFRRGKLHGKDISFDFNGDTTLLAYYHYGTRRGDWRFFENGKLFEIQHYDKNGNRSGWNYKFYPDGKLREKTLFTVGDTAYSWIYNSAGTLHSRGMYTAKGMDGRWYFYSHNDTFLDVRDTLPTSIVDFRSNLKHGVEWRYQKGQLIHEAYYINGLQDSVTRGFVNGVKVHEGWYSNGKRNGPDSSFTHTGKLTFLFNYKMDVRHGEQLQYDTTLFIPLTQTWVTDGVEDSSLVRDANGRLQSRRRIVNRASWLYSVEEFYTNGQLRYSGFLMNQQPHGTCTWWYADGKKKMILNYDRNRLNGEQDIWNENGFHVFHTTALNGHSITQEKIRDDRGQVLRAETDAYVKQREKYRPAFLTAFNENVFYVNGIEIRSTAHVSQSFWMSYTTTHSLIYADTIVRNGRKPPRFPGGSDAQLKWFKENLRYPEMEKESGYGATVYVEFTVQADGSIDSCSISNPYAIGLDRETLRAVNAMPDWEPAKKNGKAKASRCVMEIRFVTD